MKIKKTQNTERGVPPTTWAIIVNVYNFPVKLSALKYFLRGVRSK